MPSRYTTHLQFTRHEEERPLIEFQLPNSNSVIFVFSLSEARPNQAGFIPLLRAVQPFTLPSPIPLFSKILLLKNVQFPSLHFLSCYFSLIYNTIFPLKYESEVVGTVFPIYRSLIHFREFRCFLPETASVSSAILYFAVSPSFLPPCKVSPPAVNTVRFTRPRGTWNRTGGEDFSPCRKEKSPLLPI